MKQLWSEANEWDYNTFITAYPELQLALFILACKDYAWDLWNTSFLPCNSGFKKPDFDNAVEVYLNEIEDIISPQQPLTLDYDIDLNQLEDTLLAQPIGATVSQTYRDLSTLTSDITEMFERGLLSNDFAYANSDNDLNDMASPIISSADPRYPILCIRSLIALFILDLILPTNMKTNLRFIPNPSSTPNSYGQCHPTWTFTFDTSRIVAYMRASQAELINWSAYAYTYFSARSQANYIQFAEIYGTNDITQIPPLTISYVITNDPPPVQNSNTADFFSSVFASDIGLSLLNAVASLYPVQIATTFDWSTGDSVNKIVNETSKATVTTFFINYIFNDFIIQIDQKQSILVQYTRKVVNETYTITLLKDSAWMAFLPAILMAAAIVTAGLLLPVATTASAATGVVGPGAADALGATAGVVNTSYEGVLDSVLSSVDYTSGAVPGITADMSESVATDLSTDLTNAATDESDTLLQQPVSTVDQALSQQTEEFGGGGSEEISDVSDLTYTPSNPSENPFSPSGSNTPTPGSEFNPASTASTASSVASTASAAGTGTGLTSLLAPAAGLAAKALLTSSASKSNIVPVGNATQSSLLGGMSTSTILLLMAGIGLIAVLSKNKKSGNGDD